jgi:hypothetical protein
MRGQGLSGAAMSNDEERKKRLAEASAQPAVGDGNRDGDGDEHAD